MMPWVRLINENSGFLTLVFSAIVAIATVFYVILTRQLVRETAALRRLQSEPQLDLTLQSVPASILVLPRGGDHIGESTDMIQALTCMAFLETA